MKENKNLEWKEKVTPQYLKTVSAFSNYEGGTILFGINDQEKSYRFLIHIKRVLILKIKLMTIFNRNRIMPWKYLITLPLNCTFKRCVYSLSLQRKSV